MKNISARSEKAVQNSNPSEGVKSVMHILFAAKIKLIKMQQYNHSISFLKTSTPTVSHLLFLLKNIILL